MSLAESVRWKAERMRRHNPDLREGQALANALSKVDPGLGRQLVADLPHDPFFDDARIPAFWEWLAEHDGG